MSDETDDLRRRVHDLEQEVERLKGPEPAGSRSVRRRSEIAQFGLPLREIAVGPDLARGEKRGHARAILAVGDIATGVFALGGIACGGLCVGGVSIGIVTIGGVSLSLLIAVGGVAIAPVAFGGVAIGYFAKGGVAVGAHIINATTRDPAAVKFFSDWLPWLK